MVTRVSKPGKCEPENYICDMLIKHPLPYSAVLVL